MFKFNAHQLKWIAMIGMFLHHALYPWQDVLPLGLLIPMYAAGGLAFPILGYFVVEGYRHTSNLKRYILRLGIFGAIAIPFYMLSLGLFRFNIMFSIIVSLLLLLIYDKLKHKAGLKVVFWLIFVVVSIPMLMMFDWLFFAPLVVLLYHIIKSETARRIVPGVVAGVLWLGLSAFAMWGLSMVNPYLYTGNPMMSAEFAVQQRDMIYGMMGNTNVVIASLFFPVFCVIAALLIKNFNGERGKRAKWLFYSFYPIHLAVIAVVALITGFASFSVFGLGA
ncbi:MAG: conjugal transfer protein TraX [Oscillospiraceae bacterium]|nr:conjugal transfer protein TraX [Oscillospiraceae bacterium]